MTIMAPVDTAERPGIRLVVPQDEALRALELIGKDYEPLNWNFQYRMNLNLFKKKRASNITSSIRSFNKSRNEVETLIFSQMGAE